MSRVPAFVVLALTVASSLPAGIVTVARPKITWVTREVVDRACASPRPVAACTVMANTTLTCDCYQSGEEWKRRVRIAVAPEAIITTSTLLLHELSHVADVRAMLMDYVKRIEERTFTTPNACEAAAARVRAGFVDELAAIRDESARKRDGISPAETTGTAEVNHAAGASPVSEPAATQEQNGSGCSPAPSDPALQPFLASPGCH